MCQEAVNSKLPPVPRARFVGTVPVHAAHINSKMPHTLSGDFVKYIDLYSRERQEEIYFKFMSFITDPLTIRNGSHLSSPPAASIYGSSETCQFTQDFAWLRILWEFAEWLWLQDQENA